MTVREPASEPYPYHVLAVFFFLTLVASAGQFVAMPLGPLLIKELGLSKAQLGLVASAPFLGVVASGVLNGLVADRLGERRLALFGPQILAAAMVAFAAGQSLAVLVVASFFMGVGNSMVIVFTHQGVAAWFAPRQRALAIGVKQSAMPPGLAVVAAVAPAVAIHYSRFSAIMAIALLVSAGGLICFALYREKRNAAAGKPAARRQAAAVPPLAIMTDPRILCTTLMGVSLVVIQNAISTFLVVFAQEVLALSAVAAGFYLSLAQVAGGLGRPVFGLMSDKAFSGRRHLTMLTLAALSGCFTLVLAQASPAWLPWLVLLAVFLAGGASMGWYGPYYAMLMDIAGPRGAGVANGFGMSVNCFGSFLAGPLFGFIVDYTGSYRMGFMAFGAWVLLVGLVFSLSPAAAFYRRSGGRWAGAITRQ